MKSLRHPRLTVGFYLFFMLYAVTVASNAQTESNAAAASLEGLTEAILIDGQPALRILSRKNGTTEVRRQVKDNETVLVFDVYKIPMKAGKLTVSGTKLFFDPEGSNKNYFKIEKSEIKEVILREKSKMFVPTSFVEVVTLSDTKKVSIQFTSDYGNNKEYAIPGNTYLMRSITDFDSAIKQFDQLTASIRGSGEAEEETEEEDLEADVYHRFDRFRDVTVVATSRILLKGRRSIRISSEYSFSGKNRVTPDAVSFRFHSSANRPTFREEELNINFLVDGKRVPLGEGKIVDEEKTKTATKQTVSVSIPYKVFETIANGGVVEFQIGSLEYKLTEKHLGMLKGLLAYKPEN